MKAIAAAHKALTEAIANGEHDIAATYANIIATLTAKSQSYVSEAIVGAVALIAGMIVGHLI